MLCCSVCGKMGVVLIYLNIHAEPSSAVGEVLRLLASRIREFYVCTIHNAEHLGEVRDRRESVEVSLDLGLCDREVDKITNLLLETFGHLKHKASLLIFLNRFLEEGSPSLSSH